MKKDNLTKIVFAVVAIVFIGGMIWISQSNLSSGNEAAPLGGAVSAGQKNKTGLVAEEQSFDFGSISMAAGKVKKTVKLANSGDQPALVKKIYTSCMCTVAILSNGGKQFGPFGMPGHGIVPSVNQAIAAGQSAELEIVFDPAAHGPAGLGKISRVVTVETDSGSSLEIGFSATVTP